MDEEACVAVICFVLIMLFLYPILKDKAIPLQALTGPDGSSRLRLPDIKTIDT
jgi:biotin transporter BioY